MAAKQKKPAQEAVEPEEEKDVTKEQIEVFEPVGKAVDIKLTHPDGSERTFVQHELGFLSKLKFFRLLTGTIRLASTTDEAGLVGFVANLIEAFSNDNPNYEELLATILTVTELIPDFVEETFLLALNIKPEDELWVREAFAELDDDQGIEIVEVFVSQNGEAIRDFFNKRLRRVGLRIQKQVGSLSQDTE